MLHPADGAGFRAAETCAAQDFHGASHKQVEYAPEVGKAAALDAQFCGSGDGEW